MALKIRRDDEVVVISGKDRGKTGKVLKVDPKKSRVTVEGINIVKRHQRPVTNAPQIEAGVIESRPLSRSKRWRLLDVVERSR